MLDLSRMHRSALVLTTLAVGFVLLGPPASASTFRPIPLPKLVQQSSLVIVGTPVSRETHWATIGPTSRLVTDMTVEVAWTLRGTDSTGQSIIVRTLGGTFGDIGQIVHGEAQLALGQSCLLFLGLGREGAYHVMGMAQGHYPIERDVSGSWRVVGSPGLEGVLSPQLSAVGRLRGRPLMDVPAILESPEETAQ